MTVEGEPNPFVGPRPFEQAERELFFGRAKEARDVVSLITAQPILLLFAASGAGKSSLLNAAVVPALHERGFEVLGPARVRVSGDPPPDAKNVYTRAVLTHVAADRPSGPQRETVAEGLAELPRPASVGPRALIVDQFEELFTAYPEHWEERTDFVDQLRAALDADRSLRVVLALREDFLAQVEPLAPRLPRGLRARFRLERLNRDAALVAVTGPLQHTRRRFAPGVAEALVSELRKLRVDAGDGQTTEFEGEFVEPVQLQVVCRNLWEELPPDADEITGEHVHALADVDHVLGQVYDTAVASAVARHDMREGRLRNWVQEELITPGGTRAAVWGAGPSAGGMPHAVVETLVQERLVRTEWRAGAPWYELTHDRLIRPIQRSNERYFAGQARRRRRGLLAALALLAVVLAAILGAIFGYGANGSTSESPAAHQTRTASLSLSQTGGVVTYRTYLRLAGSAAVVQPRQWLGKKGWLLRVHAAINGFKGERLRLEYSFTGQGHSARQIAAGRTTSESETVSALIWIPIPLTERRIVFVSLREPGGHLIARASAPLTLVIQG